MGMPIASIYANELIQDYDVQTLIRIGSCGGHADHVGIRDVILCDDSIDTIHTIARHFQRTKLAPVDYGCSLQLRCRKEEGVPTHVGGI
jgi:purine-nucleoside phosphorylase